MKTLILSLCMLSFAAFGQTPSDKDKKFMMEAAEGGLIEVKLGELASAKGSSEEIKNLGQHMVTDHTKANKDLMALASKKNISLPTTLSKKGQEMYDKLSKLSGEKFDKAYAKMMVKDHKKDVSEFKKESEKGDDSDVKSWAASTLPTLQHHLDMSKEACDNLKKK